MVDYSDSWTPAGDFGIVEDVDTTGGLRVVENSTERLSIPAPRRKKGMRVVQADNNVVYILNTNNLSTLTEADFIEDGGTGDVTQAGTNTFTGVNTFNVNYITGSITGSDAKFTSLTGSVRIPDKTITINSPSPVPATDLSLRLASEASGLFRSAVELPSSPSNIFANGLGLSVGGRVVGATFANVAIPGTSQTVGGALLNSGDSYTVLQIGKPMTVEYAYQGGALHVFSNGGERGAAAIVDQATATGTTGDPTVGANYTKVVVGSETFYRLQYPAFRSVRGRGSLASPTAVSAGDILGDLRFDGRTTTGAVTIANANEYQEGAIVRGIAEETFTPTAQGTGLGFWTVPNGNKHAVSDPPRLWINNQGNVGIGLGASSTAPWSPVQATYKLEVSGSTLLKGELAVSGSIVGNVKVEGSFSSPIQTSTYALSSNDRGKTLLFSSTSDQTITCSPGLDVGFNCTFIQLGVGQIILTAGSGVILYNRQSHDRSAGQYAAVSVVSIDTNRFIISGDTA